MKICLDAGHYGKYNQSTTNSLYYESEAMWNLHLLLKSELESYGIEVTTTRTQQAVDLSLWNRGQVAKGCDLLLSLHSNASSTATADYPLAVCLAEDSTTSIDDVSRGLGEKLASLLTSLMQTTQAGRILTKKADFDRNGDGLLNDEWYGILHSGKQAKVPTILLEHSFHTNAKATEWLLKTDNLKALAKAEAKTIADYFGITATATESNKMYRVQVGAFKSKTNAESYKKTLETAGFNGFIVTEDI